MPRRRRRKAASTQRVPRPTQSNLGGTDRIKADFRHLREHLWRFSLPIELFLPSALPVCRHRAPCQPSNVIVTSVSLDGSTVLVIKTDMTYTVTHQTTHVLPPAGPQNALDESHKKPSAQQAGRSNTLLARCRRAHVARGRRWRSQKHRWWPSAGVSGGGRSLTCRSRSLTQKWSLALWMTPTKKARF